MLPFSLAMGLLWFFKNTNLLNYAAVLSQKAHLSCQLHVGESSPWHLIYSALTCGSKIYDFGHFAILQHAGLVHLFVLSGAHLVFAERLLQRITQDSRKVLLALIGLCLISGLKAPALRALIHWCTKQMNLRKELHWSLSLQAGVTGLTCLALNPHWWLGLSLPLSWVATLSFSLFPNCKLKSLIMVYSLSLPLLISLNPANPMAIFINLAFSPLFFTILFPLSWLAGVWTPLQIYVDPLWSFCFSILDALNTPLSFHLNLPIFSAEERWLYVFLIQGICYLKERLD